MNAIVADRGQVTIPKPLREKMGIRPSTVLSFSIKHGALIAVKKVKEDPVNAVLGCLKTDLSSDELMVELRGAP